MTKEDAMKTIESAKLFSYDAIYEEAFDMAIKALEEEPTTKNDLALIHTEGLDEEIRCTMCTNYMKSDRGCDGSCVVDKDMYKAIMDAIEKRIQPTTKNDLSSGTRKNSKKLEKNFGELDCILRADALRVAKNEYLRGWHNALCKALSEKYSIHCEEGNFRVIQEETITGLGLSMNCALGKDVESYMSTMPSVTPQELRKGKWLRMSDLSEQDDYRYKCSCCGNVINHKSKIDLYTFNSWCGRCGSDNGIHMNYEVEE